MYYSYRTIEAKARSIITQHCRDCINGSKAVPIEELAEKVFGLSIEYQYLTKYGQSVLGKLICKNGVTTYYDAENNCYGYLPVEGNTILIEARLLEDKGNYGRYRFTIAHELAHWILHRDIILAYPESEATYTEIIIDNKLEQQADYMAAELLMPLSAIKRYYYNTASREANIEKCIDEMAEHFGVSRQALKIRLERHKMI